MIEVLGERGASRELGEVAEEPARRAVARGAQRAEAERHAAELGREAERGEALRRRVAALEATS